MTCPDCHDRLQQWLDARSRDAAATPGEPPALCAACSDWAVAARHLDRGLPLLVAPAPSSALTNRILAQVAADRSRRRTRLVLAVGAVAAAAVLLVAVWKIMVRGSPIPASPSQPPPMAKAADPEPTPAPVPLRDSMAEAGSAVASLTTRTADETVAKTKLLLPVVTDPSLATLDLAPPPLDPPARSLREAGEGVTVGLEPVAESARRAVGLFFRELPSMDAHPKTGF